MVAWYWMLILVLVALVLSVVIGFLWGRNKGGVSSKNQKALHESELQAIREQLHAERKARQLAVETAKVLAAEQKRITSWYNDRKASIKAEARNAFEKMATDGDAIDARLERLLSDGRDDDTSPG